MDQEESNMSEQTLSVAEEIRSLIQDAPYSLVELDSDLHGAVSAAIVKLNDGLDIRSAADEIFNVMASRGFGALTGSEWFVKRNLSWAAMLHLAASHYSDDEKARAWATGYWVCRGDDQYARPKTAELAAIFDAGKEANPAFQIELDCEKEATRLTEEKFGNAASSKKARNYWLSRFNQLLREKGIY